MQKKVLITGASSGIGLATAELFAQKNYKIIAIGRNTSQLKYLRQKIGKEHKFIQFDLNKIEKIPILAKKIEDYGGVDVLINNAGIGLFKPFEKTNDFETEKIITINLLAPIALTRALFRTMKEKGGTVVNISSVAGKRTWKHLTIYSASKFGLIGFSNSLRRECKYYHYPIKVIVVCPPATDTAFFENAGYIDYKKNHPNQNLLSPQDVAREIYNGVINNKREVIIGGRAKILDKMASLFPVFTENLEDKIKERSHKH